MCVCVCVRACVCVCVRVCVCVFMYLHTRCLPGSSTGKIYCSISCLLPGCFSLTGSNKGKIFSRPALASCESSSLNLIVPWSNDDFKMYPNELLSDLFSEYECCINVTYNTMLICNFYQTIITFLFLQKYVLLHLYFTDPPDLDLSHDNNLRMIHTCYYRIICILIIHTIMVSE